MSKYEDRIMRLKNTALAPESTFRWIEYNQGYREARRAAAEIAAEADREIAELWEALEEMLDCPRIDGFVSVQNAVKKARAALSRTDRAID